LTLTTIAPAFSVPNSVTGYWKVFGSMIATRSPGFTPIVCRYDANASTFCASAR